MDRDESDVSQGVGLERVLRAGRTVERGVEVREPARHEFRHEDRIGVFEELRAAVRLAERPVRLLLPCADRILPVDGAGRHDRPVQIEEVLLRDTPLLRRLVEQVDGAAMPVDLLVLADRLASDRDAVFEDLDRLPEREGVSLDGVRVVRPERGDLLQDAVASRLRDAFEEQRRAAPLRAKQKRADGVVGDVEPVLRGEARGHFAPADALRAPAAELRLVGKALGPKGLSVFHAAGL